MPYGYLLIDYQRREVDKGSDLFGLKILIATATNSEQTKTGAGNGNDYTKIGKVNHEEEISAVHNHTPEIELGKILADFFNEIERANYHGD